MYHQYTYEAMLTEACMVSFTKLTVLKELKCFITMHEMLFQSTKIVSWVERGKPGIKVIIEIYKIITSSFSSRAIRTGSPTSCLLYIYFLPSLRQIQIDNDNIGRNFRSELLSFSENGIEKLALGNKYVLGRSDSPGISATVGKSPLNEFYVYFHLIKYTNPK